MEAERGMDSRKSASYACTAYNFTERRQGYSPFQWAFGRDPTWAQTLFDEEEEEINTSQDSTPDFVAMLILQQKARALAEDTLLRTRVARAKHARTRRDRFFLPGDREAIWRAVKHSQMGAQRATWLGPGTVLATETRAERDGTRRPASIVWIILNGRLYRCSPQQVRRRSLREVEEKRLTPPEAGRSRASFRASTLG